jgi:hypothetical protein
VTTATTATTTRTDMTTAHTILQQLGGSRFIAMTGARSFVGSQTGLTFKLPARFARGGINVVRIALDPSDTYTVEFGKLWGLDYRTIKTLDGVYAEDLQDIFTDATGLDTHL